MKKLFEQFLAEKFREQLERFIIRVAIVSFIIHLLLIFFVHLGYININSKLTQNPISAIYTPFSFILVYEVFLLVFYLPRSISSYIGKQYEIITLIVIRRIFNDIGNMEMTPKWFTIESDRLFTYDLATALLLFFLIQRFYKNLQQPSTMLSEAPIQESLIKSRNKYIVLKHNIAKILVPLVMVLAAYSFVHWIIICQQSNWNDITAFKKINNIFFEDFFILLIIIDVILLLFSFLYTNDFHKIIRNSGFVISTILIKLSFSVEGIINNLLILGAVVFGYVILLIHNSYKSIK